MSIKILCFNESYNARVFSKWGNEEMDFKTDLDIEGVKPEKEIEENLWNVYQKFLISGKSINDKLQDNQFTGTLLKEALNYI